MVHSPDHESAERRQIIHANSPAVPQGETRQTGFEHTERVDQTPAGVERRELRITDQSGTEHYEQIVHDKMCERRLRFAKVEQVVWLILAIVEVLIGLRVFSRLIAANPSNGFVHLVYSFAGFFLKPFFGLTGNPSAGGMVLEISSLVAMLVYALVAWGIVKILWLIFAPTTARGVSTLNRYRS